jgi:hypothetical protein
VNKVYWRNEFVYAKRNIQAWLDWQRFSWQYAMQRERCSSRVKAFFKAVKAHFSLLSF